MKDLQALKEHIQSQVSLKEILVNEGIISGLDSEEQIHCPFHGADRKKSARYYEKSDSFYCWVCKKTWDIFSYLSDKKGVGFKEVLSELISTHRIDISSVPDALDVSVNSKIKQQEAVSTNAYDKYLMQLKDTLLKLRPRIEDPNKYGALVYSYMVMKKIIPLDKFNENAEKMNAALIRICRR